MPAITFNTQLQEAAERNNINLVGIFFQNRLPTQVRQGGYIFNLSNHDDGDGGSHWTAAYVEGNKAVYFDPFGTEFNEPPETIKRFLGSLDARYQKTQIQNENSYICGFYCLYFLYYMSHRRRLIPNLFQRMETFLKLFKTDPEDNRKILERLLIPLK
jgi:hypothetical protein